MSKQTSHWSLQTSEQVADTFQVSVTRGLSKEQIANQLANYGPNSLPRPKTKSLLLKFLAHFNDVLIYILLAAALVTALMAHWVDSIVIVGVTIINALIGFVQENSASKSLQSIQQMLSNTALVLRDGIKQDVDGENLVPGDIVFLKPGVKIPADLRLIEANNLMVEEALLTGESSIVEKQTTPLAQQAMLGDQLNMAFSGTSVSAGTGSGIVVATGSESQLGHINQMMLAIEGNRTPLLEQIDKLGKGIFIFIVALILMLFVFAVTLRDIPLGELALLLISLAVAAVPEGLPAIISIILSLGVKHMASKKAIIRKLPTVETLGAMSVICSDKTGTLTLNEMVAQAVILSDKTYQVTGEGYTPVGKISHSSNGQAIRLADEEVLKHLLTAIMLCNDSQLVENDSGHWQATGGPTELALKVLAVKSGLVVEEGCLVDKIPFDSRYKYMSILTTLADKQVIFLTGAPDVLFTRCSEQLTEEGNKPFAEAYWQSKIDEYAELGLRMLAAAYREVDGSHVSLSHQDIAQDMVFLGLIGIMDPPRKEAIEAIESCHQAGIQVKMITGDHQATAMAIGAQLNIRNSQQAITGEMLENLSDEQLAEVACQYDIFARTNPEHKFRLVKALQSKDEIVGMTGDGVNDAPALKQAEVGIAMGIKGTEVTKEAADMVLVDDNFATIANAVREGRRVYDNLKKTILFILPTNLAQGLLIVIAVLMGIASPLTPLQILWMNMATSTTLSFGFAFEPPEKNVMSRPPRSAAQSIFDGYALWRIAFVGLLLAGIAFVFENYLMRQNHSIEFIRTVLLQTLVVAQWVYLFNCHTSKFALDRSIFNNKGLWAVTLLLLLLQLAIIYLPFMNDIFDTHPLPIYYWGVTLLIGIGIFLVIEVEKLIVNRLVGRAVKA